MANQKASKINDIPLLTRDLCLNVFDGEIKPYQGFRKNNAPFFGGVLSPFYCKKQSIASKNTFVSEDETVYFFTNFGLYANEYDGKHKLLDMTQTSFVSKKVVKFDGYEILAISPYVKTLKPETIKDVEMDYDILAAGSDSLLYILRSDGTATNLNIPYNYGDRVYLFKSYKGIGYSIAIGEQTYFGSTTSHGANNPKQWSMISGSNRNVYNQVSTDNSSSFYSSHDGSFMSLTEGTARLSGTTVSCSPSDMVMNNKGEVVFKKPILHDGKYYFRGKVDTSTVDNSYLEVDIDTYTYMTSFGSDAPILTNLECDGNFIQASFGINATNDFDVVSKQNNISRQKADFTKVDSETAMTLTNVSVERKDMTTHFSKGYKSLVATPDGIYCGTPTTINGSYPGGLSTNLTDDIRLLYNDGCISGVSVISGEDTIGSMVSGYGEIYDYSPVCYASTKNMNGKSFSMVSFKTTEGFVVVSVNVDSNTSLKVLDNRYILLGITSYYNAYDTKKKTWKHFAPDFNNRYIFMTDYSGSYSTWETYQNNGKAATAVSAYGANYEVLNTPFPATIFAPYNFLLPKDITVLKGYGLDCYSPDTDVDIYYGLQETDGNAPEYKESWRNGSSYSNPKLAGTFYAFNTAVVPSIFSDFIEGHTNKGIIVESGHSYFQSYANATRPIYLIDISTQLEGIEGYFIIQGQYFAIVNGVIYRFTQTGFNDSIVQVDNMKLLGFTPYEAIFWSETNKTIYSFTGDSLLTPFTQADSIETIYSSKYNPNTQSVYILTDDGAYIFSSEQLLRLEYTQYKETFITKKGVCFKNDNELLFISYNKADGYEVLPIELETEFYGEGNSIKSVNDCVYIRFFSKDMAIGKIEISSSTLTEGTYTTDTKTIAVSSNMWDKVHKTLFIRYQPRYQSATGFNVKIKSPFAIATLQISNTPETVQNAKYNV